MGFSASAQGSKRGLHEIGYFKLIMVQWVARILLKPIEVC
jgi:hypothetical protein